RPRRRPAGRAAREPRRWRARRNTVAEPLAAPGILSTVPPAGLQISVVIPCLDEEAAVGRVVDQAWEGIERSGRTGEVIVVDNGSTDRSAEAAQAHGAKVVFVPRRGYGRAYLTGLAHAQGESIVIADADGSYSVVE